MVIVETSRGLPAVYGDQTGVHVSEVDYVIEVTTSRLRSWRIQCRARSMSRSAS